MFSESKKLFENQKIASDGLSFSFSISFLDNKAKKELIKKLNKSAYLKLKDKIDTELLTLLTFANFYGEAETYMAKNNVPFTKEIRMKYAKAIFKEFSENISKMIGYDDLTGDIYISPYIYDLEYGSFYRPAVQFISNTLKEWAETLTENN